MIVPKGFRFAGLACGLKKRGGLDVGLLVADELAIAAGVFTRNLVKAAPVLVAMERIKSGSARAILVNSGCANACTGEPGMNATLLTTRALAEALHCQVEEILPASTGVIGEVLRAPLIVSRVPELIEILSPSNYEAFSQSILTTDRWPKVAEVEVGGSSGARILAMAKGAGMIHPDLSGDGLPHATMLAFAVTDAICSPATLARALERATEQTFNACSVDGDTSTNDSIFVLASGKAGEASESELEAALVTVFSKLAQSIVADGEGSEHLVELQVSGLASEAEALQVAKTIATSLLVKTALAGKDPNWGRILAAAGRARVKFDPNAARIAINDIAIVENGVGVGSAAEASAKELMQAPSFSIRLSLGTGPGHCRYFMTDLGHQYVDVNAGYRS